MIDRKLTEKILRDLEWSPIIGLVGSRQVGKTTLVKHIQKIIEKPTIYLDLELQDDWMKLEDAQSYLSKHQDKCVIIDEVQIRPELFALLRGLTDQKREPGRFILLGSAAPHIVKLNTETLAGRITYHELSPFSYSEIKHQFDQNTHWLKGGFPIPLLAEQTIISRKWMSDFVETFIHRDLARLGFSVAAPMLRNMMMMLAHLHGDLLNSAKLSRSLGVTSPTVNKYLEILEGSFLIRRLPPYYANIGKRLTRSPKIYIRDSGLLHFLHRINDEEQLRGNPAVGNSWEGYVIEQIIREAPEFSDFYFYRTQKGTEVDLLMITASGKKVFFEIKFSVSPKISRGYYLAIQDLNPDYKFVVTPGGEAYEKEGGIQVISLQELLNTSLSNLK